MRSGLPSDLGGSVFRIEEVLRNRHDLLTRRAGHEPHYGKFMLVVDVREPLDVLVWEGHCMRDEPGPELIGAQRIERLRKRGLVRGPYRSEKELCAVLQRLVSLQLFRIPHLLPGQLYLVLREIVLGLRGFDKLVTEFRMGDVDQR